jgi:CRISPR type III-B/RAMP module-associated protein Cmr5
MGTEILMDDKRIGRIAFELLSKVKRGIEGRKDLARGVRTRCRSMYSFFYYSGSLPTLAFIYSKAGEDLIKDTLGRMKEDAFVPLLKKDEDLSYAIYGALICCFLNEIGMNVDGSLSSIIKALGSDDKREKSYIIDYQILRFAKWLRRFGESLFTGG